uniref:Uncharacterized protein n=1 Tax=Seriola lalandi dorsalis TaxID=1841481 RepID=A0A3B4WBI7_SERLL
MIISHTRDIHRPSPCCHCPSLFPNVIPASHEPSIITDSRLIGHHGLFNHEVKSIDIERLLSEQGKLEKSGQKTQKKNHAISHPSSTTHIPPPLSSKDLLCADTDAVVPFEKKADPATNICDDSREKEKKIITERSRGPHYNDSNIQPFFLYQTQLPDRRSAEPMHFPQEQDPFETDRYSLAPSFSTQIHHPNQSNHFQPFSQFSHPSTCPPFRSHNIDMMHYPPSHVLERGPALPLSSLPSPEHWSFPPMKLY